MCSSFHSSDSNDRQINGIIDEDFNDESKPKVTNKSQSNDHRTDSIDDCGDEAIKQGDRSEVVEEDLRPCNGELRTDNCCKYKSDDSSVSVVDRTDEERSPDKESSNKCNRTCCALFAIYTERKLIKGQRFGPYLVKLNSSELREADSKDTNDKENQFKDSDQLIELRQILQVQEPTGFWLKIVRTSSTKPTAFIQLQGIFCFFELRFDKLN